MLYYCTFLTKYSSRIAKSAEEKSFCVMSRSLGAGEEFYVTHFLHVKNAYVGSYTSIFILASNTISRTGLCVANPLSTMRLPNKVLRLLTCLVLVHIFHLLCSQSRHTPNDSHPPAFLSFGTLPITASTSTVGTTKPASSSPRAGSSRRSCSCTSSPRLPHSRPWTRFGSARPVLRVCLAGGMGSSSTAALPISSTVGVHAVRAAVAGADAVQRAILAPCLVTCSTRRWTRSHTFPAPSWVLSTHAQSRL
jgi:hypothetical protein